MLAAMDLFAVILLLMPVDTDVQMVPPRYLLDVMQGYGMDWQVIDVREYNVCFNRPVEFNDNLAVVRDRIKNLCGAPFTHDGYRFPSYAEANERLVFNYLLKTHLEYWKKLKPANWSELLDIYNETNRRCHIYEQLRDARADFYHVIVRRAALRQLRDEIGEEAYYSGNLPPHVPFSAFSPID